MRNAPQSDAFLVRIQEHLLHDLADTLAWFRAQMPAYYFGTTTEAEQERHVEILHAARRAIARGADAPMTVVDDAEAGKVLVVGRSGRHRLLDVISLLESSRLLGERAIHRVELHSSRDHSLFLDAFCYGTGTVPGGFDLPAHKQAILDAVCHSQQVAAASAPGESSGLRDDRCSILVGRFLHAVDQGYLARSSVDRVVRHLRAWSALTSSEDVQVRCDTPAADAGTVRVLIATGGLTPWQVLSHAARVIHRHGLHLTRGYLDWVPAIDGGHKAIIATVYLAHGDHPPGEALSAAVAHDLAAVHRICPDRLMPRYLDGTYALDDLELLRAGVEFAGQLLGPDHPYLDVEEVGFELIRDQPELCRELCALLAARFQPGAVIAASAWDKRLKDLSLRAHALEPRVQALVLEAMLALIAATRLTNLYRPQRLGLALKLDPGVLPAARFAHPPFGLMFFSGAQARGFHVRFRPSARGGLRVLMPRGAASWMRARAGLLREVYDLAWAQQLKNKDIPEGGAKCIALVEQGADATAAVKQIADALIDLILPEDRCPEVIGPHGAHHEASLIFLGPDENMTPERIAYVAARARTRGLPNHATLMSSKPGAGINHKDYGVTSEGLFTWIATVLPQVGIAGDAPYTVKMTGGPDGDVGGNLIRILAREHRSRCRIIAIADGSGAAVDPGGLDYDELLRLAREGLGIAAFSRSKLGKAGPHRSGAGSDARVVAASDKAGEEFRNQLHNTVTADLFVPCGGRPYTIDDANWQRFLLSDGRPSAKACVEGANIFFTPGARRSLEDAGLFTIKDSSANKGGVICSSYEVLAGLILAEDEFLGLKSRYVADVIGLIRSVCQSEAKALIAAWKRRGGGARLSELSAQMSEEINRVSGLLEPQISQHLDDADLRETWRGHLEAHCPHVLLESPAHRDRIHTRLPRPHRVAILAKRLASRMVYKEGLTWCRAYITDSRLWDAVSAYLAAERQIQAVCFHLAGADLPGGEELVRVIAAGAQRELVRRRLGQE